MEVLEKESLSFDILECEKDSEKYLQSFENYINLLNDSALANSLINCEGTVTSPDIQGVFVKSNNGKMRIMLGQEFNPVIYRGQCNDYPFMPSSLRYELFDGNERIRHSIEWIKKNEFIRLISRTPYNLRLKDFKILNCSYEFDMEAVAKQYNCVSDYIDVTRNIMVAYFFAYTYWDSEKNQIRPIETFEFNTPMLYIGSIKELYYKAYDAVSNIGFQAITSAKAQQTLSLNTVKNYDYIKSLFKRIELPKNFEIARNVYDQFEGGRLLIPQDYASKYSEFIRGQKTLQEDLVYEYCELTKTDEEWLTGEYDRLGYKLITQEPDISDLAYNAINKEIDEYILPYLNSRFIFRETKYK